MLNWTIVPYMPILSLRPAEMRALEELPDRTKDRLLPIVPLRPWAASLRLENSLGRIADAFGKRPIVIAIDEREGVSDRPVHLALDKLRDPTDGFKNWFLFIKEFENYIPAVQLSPLTLDEERQISSLYSLERGICIILVEGAFPGINVIADRVGRLTRGGEQVCFVLDFGAIKSDAISYAARAEAYLSTLRRFVPKAYFATSATSFPVSFVGLSEQPIIERQMFNLIINKDKVIYSDHGSARIIRQNGASGLPPPRIDYPLPMMWCFKRSDDCTGFSGYEQQAKRLMTSSDWNPNFRVWGTQMIERTAAGDTSAISGPQKATAARINLHLQRQAFYDNPTAAEDTDEDWLG